MAQQQVLSLSLSLSLSHNVIVEEDTYKEEGWPLGLRLLNSRIGVVRRNGDFSGSVSFSTLISGSPTHSTYSSSDLDTQILLFIDM
ncbi:hypothetical protein QL285_085964 [Trifolium repens]|nr:hypothetical protein QL285_085964 [Trifolium repens]